MKYVTRNQYFLRVSLFEFVEICTYSNLKLVPRRNIVNDFLLSKVSKLTRCETYTASDGELLLGLSKITTSTRTDSYSSCSVSVQDNIYFSFLFTQKTFWNPRHPSCNLLTYFNGELKSFVSLLYPNTMTLLLNKSTFFG